MFFKKINLDGQVAYLKPKSEKWEPLSENSFLLLNEPDTEKQTRQLLKDEIESLAYSKQYLNDVLFKSLLLPNINFFAGSGTSLLEVNGPSMWDLWCKSMWVEPESKQEDANFKVIGEDAQEIMTKVRYVEEENPNIEHFLSQCDAYLLFNCDDSVEAFLNNVKSIILRECSTFLDTPKSDISSYENLLQKLARRRVRDPRLKVFTTNYDMCFETAASNLGMMVIDGFSYTRRRRFDGNYFNYDVVRRESDSHEFIEGVVQLYKLHGSVSWERENGGIIESGSPESL
jgi:hypothetical protein